MSDKPFVSKVLKFPTGEPIAPEGCYLVTNVLIGPYGKFKLPIKICVDKDISPEALTFEVINALACYYKWNKYPNVRPVSENGIATIVSRVTHVAGYELPKPAEYHNEIDSNTMVGVFATLATNYGWERIGNTDNIDIVKYELMGRKDNE